MGEIRDYYQILELERTADAAQIKRAYFHLIRIYSPEKAPEQFKEIKAAYETLYHPQKRQDYDKRYELSASYQEPLSQAIDLGKQLKFKEALALVKKLEKEYPDEYDIMMQLALLNKNLSSYGNMLNVAKKLVAQFPDKPETMLVLLEALELRGFKTKAEEQYEIAIEKYPTDENIWCSYVKFMGSESPWLISETILQGEKQKKYMFAQDYPMYLLAIMSVYYQREMLPEFHNEDEYDNQICRDMMECFSHCLLASERKWSAEEYNGILRGLQAASTMPGSADGLKKVLPALENHPLKTKEQEKQLKSIHNNLHAISFFDDAEIPEALKALTEVLMNECECPGCAIKQLEIELYILYSARSLKKALTYMKNTYPNLYNMNEKFYMNAMNPKKVQGMMERRIKKMDTYEKKHPDFFREEESKPQMPVLPGKKEMYSQLEFDFENMGIMEPVYDEEIEELYPFGESLYEDYPEEKPFVREAPKIGRNDPCPCGSGRKYKHCCGK